MSKNQSWPLPFVIAHRGASEIAPENTLSALKAAKQYGAQYVECDVELTQDLKPIIIHDETLDRTTNGSGLVCETDFVEIQKLDAGSWFSKKYQGEKIPTLKEWIACAAKLKIGINVEIKTDNAHHAELLAKMVVAELTLSYPDNLPTPLISSFNFYAIACVEALSTDYLLGLNCEKKILINTIPDYINSVHFPENYFPENHFAENKSDKNYIVDLHSAGLKVLAYTVNALERANQLREMGVDGIFSNNEKLFSS